MTTREQKLLKTLLINGQNDYKVRAHMYETERTN